MTDATRPAKDLTRIINSYPGLFRDLVDLCDAIAKIGSIEQATEEARKRLASLREQNDSIQASIDTQIAAGDKILKDQDDTHSLKERAAAEEADAIVGEAKMKATNIVAAAETFAKETEAKLNKTIDKHTEMVGAATDEFNAYQRDIGNAKEELAILMKDITKYRDMRQGVMNEILALRDKLGLS